MKLLWRVCAIVALAAAPVSAKFASPEKVPVDRLLELADAVLDKDPDNVEAIYTLARIHFLAFACGVEKLDAYTRYGPLPEVGPRRQLTDPNPERQPQAIPANRAADHITQALHYFHEAMRIAPRNGLYRLGYASLLEQSYGWMRGHPESAVPDGFRSLTPAQVREEYRQSWEIDCQVDLDQTSHEARRLMEMVSYEAGRAYIRMVEADKLSTEDEKQTAEKIRTLIGVLSAGQSGFVTPIILSRRPVRSIDDLLEPEKTVDFPLRGWGRAERWPWVKPETAILVWNPSGSGKIASGAQLFGSYTWELFWTTGYDALAVLDADHDGELHGPELEGLALWCDTNGNGLSDPGEVHSLAEYGVVALATKPASFAGQNPMNAQGVTFEDGQTLPTWDWVVHPIPQPEISLSSAAENLPSGAGH